MKKNERGAALAYTLLTMMIVFTLCALLLTLALTQTQNTKNDRESLGREIAVMQIGEWFRGAKGEYENAGGEPSPFAEKLAGGGYSVEEKGSGEWLAVKEEEVFSLRFSSNGSSRRMTVGSASGGTIYLSVGLNGDGTLSEWSKGERG